jgi:CheY-like chemotaxis protein
VYGVVKQSGGYISVYSELGRGTSFKIYLPRTDEHSKSTSSQGARDIARGRETILLVEDSQTLRQLARELLESDGYKVLEAANGAHAIKIAEKYAETIHLLLTDVVMPVMDGRKLADHMVQARPEIKVLYMSGFTDDAIVHHGVLKPGVALLEKPFTKASLTRKVRDVLAGTKAQAGMQSETVPEQHHQGK